MRKGPLLALCLCALLAAPRAHADTIYVVDGSEPQLQNLPAGWQPAWVGQIARTVTNQQSGQRQQIMLRAIRGRIVRASAPGAGPGVFFEVLLYKKATKPNEPQDPQGFTYAFLRPEIFFAQSQLKTVVYDFDAVQDLRWLLGNDDLRLAEAAMANPGILRQVMPNAQNPQQLMARIAAEAQAQSPDPDNLMSIFGHGKVPAHPFVLARMGLGGQVFNGGTTPYADGWLTLLVRQGPPPDLQTYAQAVNAKLKAGDFYNAVTMLPYHQSDSVSGTPPARPAPEAGPAPVTMPGRVRRTRGGYTQVDTDPASQRRGVNMPAASERPDIICVDWRSQVHALLEAAARDDRYGGIFLGQSKQGHGILKLLVLALLRRATELANLNVPAGPANMVGAALRARQVGELTREALIEALEAAQAGRSALIDNPGQPQAGSGFSAGSFLPVDPSELAVIALQTIQSNPTWAQASSPQEARRLVQALVELARDPEPSDPRSRDRFRLSQGVPAAAIRVQLRREVFDTLASAARQGLLLQPGVDLETATPDALIRQGLSPDEAAEVLRRRAAPHASFSTPEGLRRSGFNAEDARRISARAATSPYLKPLIELVGQFDARDRTFLLRAMAQAGTGPSGLYEDVVGRLFSILLDNENWQVDPQRVRELKGDAMAALGLLAQLDANQPGAQVAPAGNAGANDGRDPAQLIFERLDAILAARQEGKASEDEKRVLELINHLSATAYPAPATTYVPEESYRRRYAGDLNRAYRGHVARGEQDLAGEMGGVSPTSVDYQERMAKFQRRREQMVRVREAMQRGALAVPITPH
ncbi:MAG: hypothetical protein AB7N76_17540 [Planctomycetota bacterium]